ncbi:MAG: histidine kinase [Clostridia bacterium]|nr:histidine kinase [Clostridia bacterium]
MKVSIRLSVLAVLVSFVLFVSFLLIYSINDRFNDRLLSMVMDDIENVVEGCEEEITDSIMKVQNSNDALSFDREFVELVKSEPKDIIEKVNSINKLVQYAGEIRPQTSSIDFNNSCILFIDSSQPMAKHLQPYIANSVERYTGVVTNEGLEKFEWYRELLKSKRQMYFFEHSDVPNCVFFAQIIYNHLGYSGEVLGVSLVAINFEGILRNHRHIDNKSFLETVIVNNKGEVICTGNEAISAEVIGFASTYYRNPNMPMAAMSSVQIDGEEYFACKHDLDFDMTLVAAIPKDEACITIEEISHQIFWTVVLILLLALVMAVFLSGIVAKPIKQLSNFMTAADESSELNYKIKTSHIYEVDSLYNAFNDMLLRIKHLLKVSQRLGEQKKEAEFKMLQSQINPHYLYNALDSMTWMALRKGDDDIADMAEALADSFRYSAKTSEMMIEINNELLFIENYIKLQEKCHKRSFNLDIYIEEGLENVKIQKFMIQPLVENAVVHGLSRENKSLAIKISVKQENDFIKIYTEDNGKGYDAELLNKYIAGDKTVFQTEKIGIMNIHNRLQIKYGEQAGLYYQSNECGGLTAVIAIPFNKGEKSDEIF